MIRPLPEELRGLLARGEVLFSLRDVVRELLENALDAGAKRVRVELYGGGRERAFPEGNTWRAFPEGNTWRAFPEGNTWRIVVEDDGQGIPLAELPLAVEPFATSKLLDPGRITALGFRGQALYALRQAALLRIRSRPRFQVGGGLLLAQGERV
ncbi:ATP-binding protein, partial [Thermus scotoductus]